MGLLPMMMSRYQSLLPVHIHAHPETKQRDLHLLQVKKIISFSQKVVQPLKASKTMIHQIFKLKEQIINTISQDFAGHLHISHLLCTHNKNKQNRQDTRCQEDDHLQAKVYLNFFWTNKRAYI